MTGRQVKRDWSLHIIPKRFSLINITFISIFLTEEQLFSNNLSGVNLDLNYFKVALMQLYVCTIPYNQHQSFLLARCKENLRHNRV